MYAEARRATGRDEAFCLDIVQDAMLRVIRSMKRLDSEARLRGWLKVVVRSCAYDRFRRESRRRKREVSRGTIATEPVGDESTRDRLDWLREAIATLDEPSARMLIMRHRFGWSLERIGSALGLSTGAVDGRLRRIVSALRRRRPQELIDEP
jgi:RNA polymerase sigma-70 factor (ECF subfamily)